MANSPEADHVLSPSLLGQYVSYDGCPRYFRFRTTDADVRHERNWWDEESLGVLLSEVGTQFEADQLRELADVSRRIIGLPSDTDEFAFTFDDTWATGGDDATAFDHWEETNRPLLESVIADTAAADRGDGPAVLYQLPMAGEIEHWGLSGLSDILLVYPTDDSETVRTLLLEVKASWSEKTAHQIQAAVYATLLDDVVATLGYDHEAAAAIVNREQSLDGVDLATPPDLKTFDLDSRLSEVRRLLREDGELHAIAEQPFDEVGFQLNQKCDGCEFNEICFTTAVESRDPALLGLTQGDRERLASHGIETLGEFADLFDHDDRPKPFEYDGLVVPDDKRSTVQALSETGTLGNRLQDLVQRAHLLAGELDPSRPSHDFVQFLKGSGNGSLPEDNPRGGFSLDYPERSLIRVYLYVQPDHVRDRIALIGARIDGHDIEPRTVVEFTETLPMGQAESRDAEATLLKRFFRRLFTTLQDAAEAPDYCPALDADEAYFHLYVYTQNERDALFDAVQRHPTLSGSDTVRDLLGLREGIDQSMVSVVHQDLTDRLALRYPGTGLVQTAEQMVTASWRVDDGYHDLTSWSADEWTATVDGESVDLRSSFRTGLFERWKPYHEVGDAIDLQLAGSDTDPDGFYPVRNRFGSQIPIEYIWGIHGELTALADGSAPRQAQPEAHDDLDDSVRQYLYHDHTVAPADRERITEKDVTALCRRLCHALQHTERSITYKNAQLGKEPLPVDLPTFGLPDASLARACQEYLSLEHATSEQERREHYMDTPLERVKSGESVIVRITDIQEREGDFGTEYELTADLPYDDLFRAPDRVLDSCKVSGGDGSSSGSWLVMTPLDPTDDGGFEQVGISNPSHIRNSTNVTVESFDRTAQTIQFEAGEAPKHWYNYRFITWHRGLTSSAAYAEKDSQYKWSPLEVGDLYILDPYADSWPHERAYAALDHADTNTLYDLLYRAYTRGETSQFDAEFCDPDAVTAFLVECDRVLGTAPKGKQRTFVEHAEAAIAVLQGPPGTGKTSYTLAPAVLSRIAAFDTRGETLVGGVGAPSHTAVNEALEAVVARLREYRDAGVFDGVADVRIFRVGGTESDLPDGVRYVDYYDADDVAAVRDALEAAAADDAHVLLFATSTSMRGLVDKLVGAGYADADGAEDFMARDGAIYDLLVVDEASMLDLPNTLLLGAFLRDGGQALVIGDHRQMEPVQTHEWESEDRRSIEENVPFMSALNFVRFLRGDLEDIAVTDQDSPQVGDAIPMTGLDRTYRMHKLLADILTRLVYQDDGITLQSDQTATLDTVQSVTPGVDRAMASDAPVVLIIHDEAASQDANLTEVALVDALSGAIDDANPADIGVVTPHNAQKSRLQDQLGDRVTPNTVEKFQGGERDAIFVSATASDPDYVRAESDFLLDPNRLNVALSRMKQKLVVIASESVFQIIPTDASDYDEAVIWKRLYSELGALDPFEADRHYTLGEFLPEEITAPETDSETTVSVYTLTANE